MESSNCDRCDKLALFLCDFGHEISFCTLHMNEHKESCKSREEAEEGFVRKAFKLNMLDRNVDVQRVVLRSGFGFVVRTEKSSIPDKIMMTLNELSFTFANCVANLANGCNEQLQSLCFHFAEALKEIVYNIEIDHLILTNDTNDAYCKFHSEKQSLISALLSKELDTLENFLNMPKKATKNLFAELDLNTIKQNFIYNYFMRDSIDVDELFTSFCKSFTNFIGDKKVSLDIFDDFREKYRVGMEELCTAHQKELLIIAADRWLKLKFQRSSIIAVPLFDSSPPLTVCSLFIKECVVRLSSVTKLSESAFLLILLIETSSYLVLYNEKGSVLLHTIYSSEYLCAEGSDSHLLLLYNKNTNTCELFHLQTDQLEKGSDLDLKLEKNENIIDLIFIQGESPKVIFSTNLYPINQIFLNSHRTLVNLIVDPQEFNWKLLFYKSKSVVILKSNKKIRVFSEHLVRLGDFSMEIDNLAYVECEERELRVVGTQQNKLVEVWFHVNLEYKEATNRKRFSVLPSVSTFTRKSYEGKVFSSTMSNFQPFFERIFLVN